MKFQWGKRLFQKKETKDSKEKQNHEEIKQHRLAFIAAAVCSVVVGITGAWLVNRANIATLFTVSKPSIIAVKGPNGEEMAQLDLSYTDADKDKNGKVTIRRVISVVSDQSEHKIEIAHTTNLKGLNFEVHMATDVTKDSTTGQYAYTISKQISGEYLNRDKDKSKNGYNYADSSKHSFNYSDYQNVQSHAEPLYWLETSATEVTAKNTDGLFLQNYVITISWIETGSTKETDLFYVLAKNIEGTPGN
ncbi:hypothetical protein MSB04_05935 [bacterium]|nr:hypothetical protein [bacterium]